MGIERLDSRVRKAFKAMCDKYNLYQHGEEVLDATQSDITFPTDVFPYTVKAKGCVWIGKRVPWRVRNIDGIAFRAELRKRGWRSKDYLAVMWKSYCKEHEGCKIKYYTNYLPFIQYRENLQGGT